MRCHWKPDTGNAGEPMISAGTAKGPAVNTAGEPAVVADKAARPGSGCLG